MEVFDSALPFAAFLSPGVRKVIMLALLALIAALGLFVGASTIVIIARDGYRRVATREA